MADDATADDAPPRGRRRLWWLLALLAVTLGLALLVAVPWAGEPGFTVERAGLPRIAVRRASMRIGHAVLVF